MKNEMKVYQFSAGGKTLYVAGSDKEVCREVVKEIYADTIHRPVYLYGEPHNFRIDVNNLPDYVINADEYRERGK